MSVVTLGGKYSVAICTSSLFNSSLFRCDGALSSRSRTLYAAKMSHQFELKGKVALITGGASGIGFGIAKALLENGVQGVALLDINAEQGQIAVKELAKRFNEGCAVYIKTDVSDKLQFEEAFEQTIKIFRRLDIVVNNAGIIQELQWDKCIAINLQGCVTGSLLALHKYFPKCLDFAEGIILNVASAAGFMALKEIPVYTATKHGVIGFSRSIALSTADNNSKVKVLVICPGATNTAMHNLGTDQVSEETALIYPKLLQCVHMQTIDELVSHIIPIMKECETGSVWIIENNSRRNVEFPTLFQL